MATLNVTDGTGTLQYDKDDRGVVHVWGAWNPAAKTYAGTTVATLPQDHCPAATSYATLTNMSGGTGAYHIAINTDGRITVPPAGSYNFSGGGWKLYFPYVSFPAA